MISVIGHGARPCGKGWGPEIDKNPVIRMSNWRWEPAVDYGERCDYVVIWGHQFTNPKSSIEKMPTKGVIVETLTDGLLRGKGKFVIPVGDFPAFHRNVPTLLFPEHCKQFCNMIHPFKPTRGALAVYLAGAALKHKEILMVGMDKVATGKVMPHSKVYADYVGRPNLAKGRQRGGANRHDAETENAVLFAWAKRLDINLMVAGDGWP